MNNEIYKSLQLYEEIKKRYEYECGMCGKDIMDMMFGPVYQIQSSKDDKIKRVCEDCHKSFDVDGDKL